MTIVFQRPIMQTTLAVFGMVLMPIVSDRGRGGVSGFPAVCWHVRRVRMLMRAR